MTFEVTKFTANHLEGAVALSQAAFWPHGRDDWAMLHRLSEGFAVLSDGQLIGTTLRFDFGPSLSALGMIIVGENHRGRGVARTLMAAAMVAQPARAFRLVATPLGQPLYQKVGFEEIAEIHKFEGQVQHIPCTGVATDASAADFDAIRQLEATSFGAERNAVIDWLSAHAQFAVTHNAGQVTGYAAMRQFASGYVIGPVVAPDADQGRTLIAHLAKDRHGAQVRLDILSKSGLANGLAEMGLKKSAVAPVMQWGGTCDLPNRLALFSQALI